MTTREGTRSGAGRKIAAAAAGGLLMCLASLLVSGERLAGTGTHHWRGWPRSFLFSWNDAARETRPGVNAFYFLQNWALWTAAAAAVLLLLGLARARRGRG